MDMNNEMDELFRKAGEDYPLNLGKPDWDAVAGKLHTDTGDLGPGFGLAAAAPRKRRRYLWLLLLLLPAGLYGIIASLKSAPTGGAETKINTTSATRGATLPETPGTRQDVADGRKSGQAAVLPSGSAVAAVPLAGNSDETDETSDNDAARVDPAKHKDNGKAAGVAIRNDQKPAQETGINMNPATRKGLSGGLESADGRTNSAAGQQGNISVQNATAGNENSAGKRSHASGEAVVSEAEGRNANESSVADSNPADAKASAEAIAGDSNATAAAETPGSPLADLVMADKAKNTDSKTGKSNTSGAVNDSAAVSRNTGSKKAVIHPSVKQNRGFYAGITAAPDFSTVKFQTMKSTGYSFGVVGGYRFNNHLSVETGLSWDRKKYYSKGEYFDKSKTRIPSNVKVTFLDGYCDMFEIPLVLRYDFSAGKRGHWFAAAGFSSYLMKNENYLYGAEANSVSWSRYVDYKNSGNNFFSIIQFSAGYEYNWSARNRIRIEPYFKAPLSGVGIGSLPISSVGMTFGFIHSFR